jgi:hypothetical protein
MAGDQEALVLHQGWIISWFIGYRMGRAKNALEPGLPQGDGWLVVASYCRSFMAGEHSVLCTVPEILETFDEYLKRRGRPKIPKEVMLKARDFEAHALGFSIIS